MSLRNRRRRRDPAAEPSGRDQRANGQRDGDLPKQIPLSPLRVLLYSLLSRYRNRPGWSPNALTVFISLLMIRISGAFLNGIADCDETYNYWEPLHYLIYGYGFQTWEYSPEFALRSYAYLIPYQLVAKAGIIMKNGQKIAGFYAVRIAQGAICALAETYLYDSVVWRFGKGPAKMFWIFIMTSPGMFRAATELLPSSFGMIAITFAFAEWYVGEFPKAISLVAIGSLFGWPYIALLGGPLALHVMTRRGWRFFVSYAAISGVVLFATMVPIDTFFFGRFVFAPLEAVLYNVLPKEGTGPSVFGVEDWTFYGINLFLNMNLSFLLTIVAYPLLWLIDAYVYTVWLDRSEALSRTIFLSPCFIWLLVLGMQPHKEERFLAPVYPLVAVCSAVTFNDWLSFAGRRRPHALYTRLFKWFVTFLAFFISGALGLSRIYALYDGYKAPVQLFHQFGRNELLQGAGPRNAPSKMRRSSTKINICVGKEWYRFPNNFYLPSERFRIRFIRQGSTGLLPKYYEKGIPDGTRMIPHGMNMFNKEDPAQFFNDPSLCDYFVDLRFSRELSARGDDDNPIAPQWRLLLYSEKFLDAKGSPPIYRAFYIPNETPKRVKYGQYQIFRNIDRLPMT